jgi:hypothetical protein
VISRFRTTGLSIAAILRMASTLGADEDRPGSDFTGTGLTRAGSRYGIETLAVYKSNWCSVPFGLSPVLFELSDQAGQNAPDTNAACV